MNKCDFCVYGVNGKCDNWDAQECHNAVERYMKVCLSRNKQTKTYNKNVNVRKKSPKGGGK